MNQVIYVSASASLGSTAVGGGAGLRLSICQRVAGSGAALADNGGDYFQDLRVPQNSRIPFSLSTIFAGLPVATYEVGLCGFTPVIGNAAGWNSNDWSRVTAFVFRQ